MFALLKRFVRHGAAFEDLENLRGRRPPFRIGLLTVRLTCQDVYCPDAFPGTAKAIAGKLKVLAVSGIAGSYVEKIRVIGDSLNSDLAQPLDTTWEVKRQIDWQLCRQWKRAEFGLID